MTTMDINIVTAGLAWAMPVRPDLLGEALEKYETVIPTLQALQMCHRFGKGPQVHITKLPNEVRLVIEDLIFHRALPHLTGWWKSVFRHVEGRCEPSDHLEDGYFDILEDVKGECSEKLCKKCQDADTGDECIDCRVLMDMKMNEGLMEVGTFMEVCIDERQRWRNMIHQGPGGNFVRLDEVRFRRSGEGRLPIVSSHASVVTS